MKNALRNVYRFKPLRTAAQSAAAGFVANGTGLIDAEWTGVASIAGMAGVVSFLMIWGEGGHMLADDKNVTKTAQLPDEPAAHEPV